MMQLINNYAQDQVRSTEIGDPRNTRVLEFLTLTNSTKLTLILSVRELYLPLAISAFWYFRRIAARRLHYPYILESSKIAVKVAGSIAFHHLHC
ncbi:hypothetical protein TNCV_3640171 [Trichonephila clavipes]|nr:hypothetical protein TNCV_3640171 [Trichonephila clavipes]